MKRVHVTADAVQAGWLQSVLEAAGIRCLLRNAYLGGASGELPLNECWPEIWVIDDADEARARRLLADTVTRPAGANWRCGLCGEELGPAFELCWKCGQARPPAPGEDA